MMTTIDVFLVQNALRNVERAIDALPDTYDVFRSKLDLITAKYDLRAALVGNVTEQEAA